MPPLTERKIIIGSRGSELALWQANFITAELKKIGVESSIKIIKTQGDKIQHLSLDKLEGKGFFTKELEEQLLSKEIDLAVHSHKDLPTEHPAGLKIAAVSYREDPSETILIRKDAVDERKKFSLKENAIVGTSSARRKSQLLAFRPDIKLNDLRGNVPTRIQKLRDKQYDAIMLANAGLERLQIDTEEFHKEILSPKEFVPAPAQGVLAFQIREEDAWLNEKLQLLNDEAVQKCIAVERKILNLFKGGCHMPLGAYCETSENDDGEIYYKVWVAKAEAWDTFPLQAFYDSKIQESLAEKIVEKLESVKKRSVFISRDPRKYDYFTFALQQLGFNVNARSLININPVPIKSIPQAEWVFFSSKNAVKFFMDAISDKNAYTYGAVGKTTADELRKYNCRATFIGNSNDTRLTGKQFAALVGSKKVLFPQAKGSMRSIQSQFPKKDQIIDLVVYESILQKPENISDTDIMVFTSPSNVESFLINHKIPEGTKIVAMGDATSHALRKKGYRAHRHTPSFDDIGLVQSVISIS